jgi:hypothetical protein
MTINQLLSDCICAARREGWTGEDSEYSYTREDCEWVISQLGRKPSRDEWTRAGLHGIGSAHVEEDE